MDYETFDRLHKSNPLLFSLAMEIFLDKGRIAVQESGREELTIAILQKVAMLLMEKNLQGIIHAAEAFAQLDTGTLLDYARRSGYFIGEAPKEAKMDGPF